MRFVAIICLSSAFAASTETTARAQDLSSFFKNTNGAFALYDMKSVSNCQPCEHFRRAFSLIRLKGVSYAPAFQTER